LRDREGRKKDSGRYVLTQNPEIEEGRRLSSYLENETARDPAEKEDPAGARVFYALALGAARKKKKTRIQTSRGNAQHEEIQRKDIGPNNRMPDLHGYKGQIAVRGGKRKAQLFRMKGQTGTEERETRAPEIALRGTGGVGKSNCREEKGELERFHERGRTHQEVIPSFKQKLY